MDRTTIVGCGPNVYDGLSRIKLDEPVILCNFSIHFLLMLRFTDVKWFITDNHVVDLPWFTAAYEQFKHLLWGSDQVAKRVKVAYQFEENPSFMPGDSRLIDHVYRAGATVAGSAMQYCYYHGTTVALCGVDMRGSTSLSHDKPVYPEGHWDFRREALNQLIKLHMPETVSLTKTALEVRLADN
jgi:hypothetical protein